MTDSVVFKTNAEKLLSELIDYATRNNLIRNTDRIYAVNLLLDALKLDIFSGVKTVGMSLEEILGGLCDYAGKMGIIDASSVVERDLFDTRLMGLLTPRPSEIIRKFKRIYTKSKTDATDYFYKICRACDYIRTYRVKKDLKWIYPSKYGDIDITINLSKPEKDPKAIAAAKSMPQSGYPKCLLCHENEGFAGDLRRPARQNLRQIPLELGGEKWYLQYSPYVYYNEHCIVLSAKHTPMRISEKTFVRMLDFVALFPHYFIGSNADLPIVGGSILTHDHMQGGRYTFAMAKAPIIRKLKFEGFPSVSGGIVHWPMSVIRLRSTSRDELAMLANKILLAWREYTDEDAFIYANTDGEPHNTITPIARFADGAFELDLVLRNNIVTEEHPLGVYHPHSELHNIKKENIGLIEVMGLAVLPSRLKSEMSCLKKAVLAGENLAEIPETAKHETWFNRFKDKYSFTPENIDGIIEHEIGATFEKVLLHAGVYNIGVDGNGEGNGKKKGITAFLRFAAAVGASAD